MKVAFKILAVRERQDLVFDILKRLGETDDSCVCWDEEHNGCMWNALQLWGSYKTLPEDVTHLCLIADDALIVNGFKDYVSMCVERFPDAIWTFATYDTEGTERGKYTPYIELWNCNLRGLCYLMPVSRIQGYLDFYQKYLSHLKRWERDDVTCKMYAMVNGIKVMMPIPNLAVSKKVPSVIPGHWKQKRITSCWYGENIDKTQFLANDCVLSKKRSLFDMHLHSDEKAYIITEAAYKRKLLLDRVMKG